MTFEIRNTKYTTLDREATFTFDFVQVAGGEWRIYIRDAPSYGGRAGGVSAHRLHDARGDYICWVPAPRTLDQAKGVARAWADATHDYIRTGSFPAPGPARHVPDISTSAAWELRDHVGPMPVQPRPPAPPRAQPQPPPQPRPAPVAPAPQPRMQVTPSQPTGLRGLLSRRNR